MLGHYLHNVRSIAPLVHCLTNYVTVNDCANILLAVGASPIMSDDSMEVEEITSICGGLAINIGTLNQQTIPSMFLAGKASNALKKPVILDPVGAGASRLRTETALRLIKDIRFAVIRGNISEIKALALGSTSTKGVDAYAGDAVTTQTLDDTVLFAQEFSKRTSAVIAITGAVDIVTDGGRTYLIRNGHPMMSRITGSGCMLTALTGAFLAANSDSILEATASSLSTMGLAGERAFAKLEKTGGGNSTYRNNLIDEIYNMTADVLDIGAQYEHR